MAGIVLERQQPYNDFIAGGRTMAARCRDDFSFQTPARLAAARARSPWMAPRFTYAIDMPVCRAWGVGRADSAARGYLGSDLRVLTLHGEWDSAPSDAGRILAQARHFPNGFAFTFPNHGHGQTLDGPTTDGSCARSIAAAFIAHPDAEPDSNCIADMPPLTFAVDP